MMNHSPICFRCKRAPIPQRNRPMIRLLNWISDFAELIGIAIFLAGLGLVCWGVTEHG